MDQHPQIGDIFTFSQWDKEQWRIEKIKDDLIIIQVVNRNPKSARGELLDHDETREVHAKYSPSWHFISRKKGLE